MDMQTLTQPFDSTQFNFNKIRQEEVRILAVKGRGCLILLTVRNACNIRAYIEHGIKLNNHS